MEQNGLSLGVSQCIEFVFKNEFSSWIEHEDKPMYFRLPIQIIDGSVRSTKPKVSYFLFFTSLFEVPNPKYHFSLFITIPFLVPSQKCHFSLFNTILFGVPDPKYRLSLINTIPFRVSYPESCHLRFIITL